jgi:hypothetical protein
MEQSVAKGYGVCPVCNGSRRAEIPASKQSYKKVIMGYDPDTDTVPCDNCGGQRQNGRATGQVKLNKEQVACTHMYSSQNVGRCLTKYVCEHCNDTYQIDSGD